MTKTCAKCQEAKPIEQFSKGRPGKFHSYCKTCMATYERERYANGDKARKERNKAVAVQKCQDIVWDALDVGCIDCGETDKVVLQFDHRDPSMKTANVADLISTGRPGRVKQEIEQCDVRCANCHVRRTAEQFGSWRLLRSVG